MDKENYLYSDLTDKIIGAAWVIIKFWPPEIGNKKKGFQCKS
jgi:hypothetical protein